jgi:hypothetical protein
MSSRIPQRKRIYLGCEGPSEQSYGKRLGEIADSVGLHLWFDCDVLRPGGGDPLALIQLAVKHIREKVSKRGPYVHRAVLLDNDKLSQSTDRDRQIQALVATHKLCLIWQIPCHEGLLLRHLPGQETARPVTSDLADQALKRAKPEYQKPMPARSLAAWIDRPALLRAASVETDLCAFLELIGLRACLRSSEQQPEEGQVDHLQAGIQFAFAVLP